MYTKVYRNGNKPTRTLLKDRTTLIVATTAVQGSIKEQIAQTKPYVLNATNLGTRLQIATLLQRY